MQEKAKEPSIEKKPAGTDTPVDSAPSSDEGSQNQSGDMNAEELVAFNKIMGEIEGDEDSGADRPSDGNPEATSDGDVPDDFSAELEKVINEAHAGGSDEAGETVDESSEDDLDEDQQKAFEKIMAQIEGGEDPGTDRPSDGDPKATSDTDASDDFSAELEKVVLEATTAEDEKSQVDSDAHPDETNNEDRQEALEKKDTDKSVPDSVEATPENQQDEETTESYEEQESVSPADEANEVAEDISDDINDILKEITSTDDASQVQPADAIEKTPEELEITDVEAVADKDIASVDDASQAQPAEAISKRSEAVEAPHVETISEDEKLTDVTPQAESELQISSEEIKVEETDAPQDTGAKKDTPLPEVSSTTSIETDSPTRLDADPLRKAAKPKRRKKTLLFVTLAMAIFLSTIAGYYYWTLKSDLDSDASVLPVTASPDQGEIDDAMQPTVSPQPHETVAIVQDTADQTRLKVTTESLEHLRNELIAKQSEIEELRTYYQAGIDAEIQGIVDRVRKGSKGQRSYKAAQADPRIRLGLEAIRRRDIYIQKLVSPNHILSWNSEELLYFYRKAKLLSLMSAKTSDIDIDNFFSQAAEIQDKHANALVELNIDAAAASPMPLKSIWGDIAKRLPRQPVSKKPVDRGGKTNNAAISKNICAGDYSHKDRLTALTPKAAGCLAQWKGKDLFLNGLTDLSPDAARQLASWEGDWLGLNGLKELSPESAIHLAKWKGKGISLNGLSRLSPRVVAILSAWQGDQIELVNVKHMAHWENPNTRLFLSEALNRKLRTNRE